MNITDEITKDKDYLWAEKTAPNLDMTVEDCLNSLALGIGLEIVDRLAQLNRMKAEFLKKRTNEMDRAAHQKNIADMESRLQDQQSKLDKILTWLKG